VVVGCDDHAQTAQHRQRLYWKVRRHGAKSTMLLACRGRGAWQSCSGRISRSQVHMTSHRQLRSPPHALYCTAVCSRWPEALRLSQSVAQLHAGGGLVQVGPQVLVLSRLSRSPTSLAAVPSPALRIDAPGIGTPSPGPAITSLLPPALVLHFRERRIHDPLLDHLSSQSTLLLYLNLATTPTHLNGH